MLAGRAGKEADARGIKEVISSARVSSGLLGITLTHVRSNQKILEVGGERGRCCISIDIRICQEEDRKLPYCVLLLS